MFSSRGGFQSSSQQLGNVRITAGYNTPYYGTPGMGTVTANSPITITQVVRNSITGTLPGNATSLNSYYGQLAVGNFSNCDIIVQPYNMENQAGYTIIVSIDGGENWSYNNTFPGGNLTVANIDIFPKCETIPSINRVLIGAYIDSGYPAVNNMFISDDLCQTWTSVNPDLYGQPVASLKYANNTVIATGFNRVSKSTDNGNTWSNVDLGTSYFFTGTAFGNNTWVITGSAGGPSYTGNNMIYSTDNGNSWVPITVGNAQNHWHQVQFANGKFVATSYNTVNDNLYAYSSDGINWTTATSPTGITQSPFCTITIDQANNFYMFSGDPIPNTTPQTGNYVISSDGVNWSAPIILNYARPADPTIFTV